jgi:hypothetical protein
LLLEQAGAGCGIIKLLRSARFTRIRLPAISFSNCRQSIMQALISFHEKEPKNPKIPRHLLLSLTKPWFQMHMYPHFGTASWAPFLSLQYFNNLVGCSQINRQTTGQIISYCGHDFWNQ